ncbi:hypothetical protein BDP27DRAFT_574046 [Rhodocollybia butyracea]|uniref:Uncharacterized protein n=1 Tax=Rhodocollybia butyracea TaxID=206335 RepID=A0A9P5PRJ0_9AGAR|nr:hypothetical protein BDP27DRAFT_574046 [Rhodocollybia butyracea]
MLSSMSSKPSTGPPSPASHSGPPTPTGYYDGDSTHSSPYDQGVSASSSDSAHSVILAPSLSRYTPPPSGPVLAPIQSFSSHDSTDALSRPTGVRITNEQYDRKSPPRSDYDRYSHYETRYAADEPRYGRLYGLAQGRSDLSPVHNYMPHQPSPMYHDMYNGGNVSLNHGAWKSEHLTGRGMKSINALVQ